METGQIILFLLPVPWTSPVIAVGSVACLITIAGIIGICLEDMGYKLKPQWYNWILAIVGSAIIYYSFTIDWIHIAEGKMPRDYPWWLLFLGEYFF